MRAAHDGKLCLHLRLCLCPRLRLSGPSARLLNPCNSSYSYCARGNLHSPGTAGTLDSFRVYFLPSLPIPYPHHPSPVGRPPVVRGPTPKYTQRVWRKSRLRLVYIRRERRASGRLAVGRYPKFSASECECECAVVGQRGCWGWRN